MARPTTTTLRLGASAAACGYALLLSGCGTADVAAEESAGAPTPQTQPATPDAARPAGPLDDVSVAAREAAASGRRVELIKRRKAGSRTYINPDGTTTVERRGAGGKVIRTTSNTPPRVNRDTKESPSTCYNGGLPAATTLTPTLTTSAADVDHVVQKAKVRVLFEVWPLEATDRVAKRLDPAKATAAGASAWVEPNTPASWRVPAGALTDGETYLWRARADDGESVSPYADWAWTAFDVDLSRDPEPGPCMYDDLDLDTAATVIGALDRLVEAEPVRYAGTAITDTGGPHLFVARDPGRADAETAAAARSAAEGAIAASPLSDQHEREAIAALVVDVVRYSRAELESVVDDISRRVEAHDPTLPDVQSWGIGENVVHIGVINLTPDQEASLHARYGDRIEVEDEGPIYH